MLILLGSKLYARITKIVQIVRTVPVFKGKEVQTEKSEPDFGEIQTGYQNYYFMERW